MMKKKDPKVKPEGNNIKPGMMSDKSFNMPVKKPMMDNYSGCKPSNDGIPLPEGYSKKKQMGMK